MPRSRCHFALLSQLHEALRTRLPDIAKLADRALTAFCAGSIAPDAMRYFSDLGKFGTHFYSEGRKETWGCAVSGLFEAHPNLSYPGRLEDREFALVLGYISHLTADEAFRDVVTLHVHGVEDWRPVIQGLWSMVDEFPLGYDGLVDTLGAFSGSWDVGFIDGRMVLDFLELVGPWAETEDPWEAEKVFLSLIKDRTPEEVARIRWLENRKRAEAFLDEARTNRFVEKAIETGVEEIVAFVNRRYCVSGK